MYKVVKKSEAKLRVITANKRSFNFITKDISPNVSLAITGGENFSEEEKAKYDRIYFVLKGKLTLIFDDEKVILEEGDSCFVKKDTLYIISLTF